MIVGFYEMHCHAPEALDYPPG
ncbi:hypothetical protein LINPERHAP1_LOCUS13156 [Linum perenne]